MPRDERPIDVPVATGTLTRETTEGDMTDPRPATIGWHDLTVDRADEVSAFYADVLGLAREPVDMGGYADFNLTEPGAGSPVAGVCHARGINADLPPQWLIYFVVADLDLSLAACVDGGGALVVGPRGLAGGRFAVIRDPAGAVCALWQPGGV